MERPFLVLWFALALFVVLGAWGIYHLVTSDEPPAPAATEGAPSTQPPLVERLRDERERRMRDRIPATAPAPSTASTSGYSETQREPDLNETR